MLIRCLLIAVLTLGGVGNAFAAWLGTAGEDPMTDQKWAAASASFAAGGRPAVVFKCWSDGRLQLGIIMGRYDDSASYATTLVRFRIDKGEPLDLVALPSNLGGNLSLGVMSEDEVELVPLLKRILDAKQRVALSIGTAVFQADVRGTTKAIGAMFAACGLEEPAAN